MALAKEETVAKYILNFSANTSKTPKQKKTKGFFLARKKLLTDYWAKFSAAHDELSELAITEENKEDVTTALSEDRFGLIEAAYCEAMGELNDLIEQLSLDTHEGPVHSTPNCTSVATGSAHKSNLPSIELPKFNGSFQEWLAFKDMFTSCVINDTSLSNVQRLHYLKTSLQGEAAVLLRNISIVGSNFSIAWDILVQRFDNKRRLIKGYLREMFRLPSMQSESPIVLRKILDSTTEIVRALKQLGRPTADWDDWLNFIITERLDAATLKDWELSLTDTNYVPTYSDLRVFLENRIQGLEAMSECSKPKQKEPVARSSNVTQVRSHSTSASRCLNCTGKHLVMFCPEFRQLTPTQRLRLVVNKKACMNCLKADHLQSACSSSYTCLKCRKRHHTMLHEALETTAEVVNINHAHTKDSSPHHPTTNDIPIMRPVLLATAQIGVRSSSGHYLTLRALLDNGSQASFISEYAAQQLHLRRTRISMPVIGVGGSAIGTSHGLVEISVVSLKEPDFKIPCSALILPRLGKMMPVTPVDPTPFKEFLELDLADSKFNEPGPIDVILGADLFGSLLYGDIKKSTVNAPVAQNTHLGWIVYGQLPVSMPSTLRPKFCALSYTELNDLIQSMWKFNQVDDVDSSNSMTQDDIYCEEYFERTVRRTCSGRYLIKYPFKDSSDLTALADSKSDAYKLFNYLQKRLEQDPNRKELYEKFMTEYLELGHMEVVQDELEPRRVCYISHHEVYKELSSTTKLRTVFNASRKTKSGISLNDCLHVGPKLQNDLESIILRWRIHQVGFMADVEKCYRQILVDAEDCDMQRIIWKDKGGNPIVYRLLTVTYGLSCSPYVTIKVFHTLAKDEEVNFPRAAKILRESFYMDDCLHGADNVDVAVDLQEELQALLKRGGFALRKWKSNSIEFLRAVGNQDHEDENYCDLNLDGEAKALGIYWFCDSDCIGYKVQVSENSGHITKRQQLSDVARIYDPPGLLAPVVVTGKIICQQLWLSGCSWDEPLPEPYQRNWAKFREELPLVKSIKVPRWTFTSNTSKSIQLHVFADASSHAYAAVAYLRVKTATDEVKVSLLMAKTKVAPLKKITIPCLELNGALLAAKICAKALFTLPLSSIQSFCWSDSKTTLSWIRSNPGRHKQYVSNRIKKIQELTPVDIWHYVPTSTNSADIASRGVYPAQLANLDLWWFGPNWLHKDEQEWPKQCPIRDEAQEVAACYVTASSPIAFKELEANLLDKYSSLRTLLAVTAWCQRFISAALKRPHETSKWCTAVERNSALLFWIRYVQKQHFSNEISSILQSKSITSKSKILKLNPTLDNAGILRLNGRLKHAVIPASERFPIILPRESRLSQLLVAQAHLLTLHGGTQTTLQYLRRRFWIVGVRSSIRQFIHQCVKCFRQRGQVNNQIMGNLPSHRCRPAPAFQHCGLDYGGPYLIRTSKVRGSRNYKGYVALFVCFSTRAVHLELVSDMTTDTFLAALRRFFAQRGYSTDIYSDCATTFVGANNQLKEDADAYHRQLQEAAREAACHGVSWHFIPPGSPHFGGMWEAGIKSMKHHLKRTIGDAVLTFEEFYTVLKQVEAVLNSRPISALSDDPTDLVALTPGHFLVGGPLIAVPEPDLLDVKPGRLTKWKQLQQRRQDFWKRWSREYLHELQVRNKWQQHQENLQVGDLVIIRDERTPPLQWNLGRILQVHAGDDKIIRVATVRTQFSVIKRAISKLIPLPIKDNEGWTPGGRKNDVVSVSSPVQDEVGGKCSEDGNTKSLKAATMLSTHLEEF